MVERNWVTKGRVKVQAILSNQQDFAFNFLKKEQRSLRLVLSQHKLQESIEKTLPSLRIYLDTIEPKSAGADLRYALSNARSGEKVVVFPPVHRSHPESAKELASAVALAFYDELSRRDTKPGVTVVFITMDRVVFDALFAVFDGAFEQAPQQMTFSQAPQQSPSASRASPARSAPAVPEVLANFPRNVEFVLGFANFRAMRDVRREMNVVALLGRYVDTWKEKFAENNVDRLEREYRGLVDALRLPNAAVVMFPVADDASKECIMKFCEDYKDAQQILSRPGHSQQEIWLLFDSEDIQKYDKALKGMISPATGGAVAGGSSRYSRPVSPPRAGVSSAHQSQALGLSDFRAGPLQPEVKRSAPQNLQRARSWEHSARQDAPNWGPVAPSEPLRGQHSRRGSGGYSPVQGGGSLPYPMSHASMSPGQSPQMPREPAQQDNEPRRGSHGAIASSPGIPQVAIGSQGAIVSSPGIPQGVMSGPLSMMTYNILANSYLNRKFYPSSPNWFFTEPGKRKRMEELVWGIIHGGNYDFMCLQEIEEIDYNFFLRGFGGRCKGVFNKKVGKPDGVAVFYDALKYDVVATERFSQHNLTQLDHKKHPSTTGAIVVTLRGTTTAGFLVVGSVHLLGHPEMVAGRTDHLMRICSHVAKECDTIQAAHRNVRVVGVVAGDLNCGAGSPPIDAVAQSGFGRADTQATAMIHGSWVILDHVLYYPPTGVANVSCWSPSPAGEVVPGPAVPSDHLPVIGSINLM